MGALPSRIHLTSHSPSNHQRPFLYLLYYLPLHAAIRASLFKHPLMSLFARTSNSLLRTSTSSITSTRTIANKSIYANLYKNTRGFKSTTSKMGVHNLSSKADFAAALKDNKIVVLDCFATWCGPCKVIAPQVVKFSEIPQRPLRQARRRRSPRRRSRTRHPRHAHLSHLQGRREGQGGCWCEP